MFVIKIIICYLEEVLNWQTQICNFKILLRLIGDCTLLGILFFQMFLPATAQISSVVLQKRYPLHVDATDEINKCRCNVCEEEIFQ